MKTRTIVITALLCSALSSAGAFAIPLKGNPSSTPTVAGVATLVANGTVDPNDPSRFSAGKASLTLDARLGHPSIATSSRGETFLFAQVSSVEKAQGKASTPINIGIVIDRSGSMSGARINNAIAGGVAALEKAREGDTVSLVTFDDTARVDVAPTVVSSETRGSIERAIRNVRVGGGTCLSCGIETSMRAMLNSRHGNDLAVNRMVVLSDGAANVGVQDIRGLRAIAARSRDNGVPISTIGVDLDFDERVMTAIANEANGKHHFVSNASGLSTIFADEFDSAIASVAKDAELSVELGKEVEVAEVFDRPFKRVGNRITIPFGTFGERQEKTVLMRLHVPANHVGPVEVGDVKLTYKDLVDASGGECAGRLALAVKDDGSEAKAMDPFVAERVERSRTSKTLAQANDLFEQGRKDEALRIVEARKADVAAKAAAAPPPSIANAFKPKGSFRALDEEFADQNAALGAASSGFAAAPSAESAQGRSERKKNAVKVQGSME